MKKSTGITTTALLSILVLSACGNNKINTETKSLYAQGLEVIQLMTEITKSEYINTVATDDIKSAIQELAHGDYSAPKAVYSIQASDTELEKLTEMNGFDNISDNLKSFLLPKTYSCLISQINGKGGVEDIAVAGICTAGKTFVNENADEKSIYLYTYDNTAPIAVTFIKGDDNSVSANGTFIMYDEFTCNSADEIKDFFDYITVEVTEVNPEK